MNCVIPSVNIKVLAKAIQAIAKIGDELFLEAHEEKLTVIAFNQCKTVCAKCEFLESFFSHFTVTESRNDVSLPVSFRIHVKTLLPVLKGAQFEKKLDYLKIEYINDSDQINFKLKYKTDDILLSHTLRLMDPEIFQMQNKINRGASTICAMSSFFNQLLAMFGSTDEDITLEVTKDKVIVRNYCIGAPYKPKSVRSQVNLNASEFLVFRIKDETTINFSLKPLRIMMHFAEVFNLQIGINFEQGGRPLLLTAKNPTFEMEFVVSTLNPYSDPNSTATTASLATKITQVNVNGLHNLTSDDLEAIANENWEEGFSDEENLKKDTNTKKNNKIISRKSTTSSGFTDLLEDINKKAVRKSSEESTKSTLECGFGSKCKIPENNDELDVIPKSPESPRTKKLKYIFKRSYEPTFHPAMMEIDGSSMVPNSDSE